MNMPKRAARNQERGSGEVGSCDLVSLVHPRTVKKARASVANRFMPWIDGAGNGWRMEAGSGTRSTERTPGSLTDFTNYRRMILGQQGVANPDR